jgi:hypothetical protein
LFAFLLIIDSYLPETLYSEVAETGYQVVRRAKRSRIVESYMKTRHFKIQVGSALHVNYPYDEPDKPPLTITVSMIFKIPTTVTYDWKFYRYSSDALDTVLNFWIPFRWFLFLASLALILTKEVRPLSYSWSHMQYIFFLACVMLMLK